MLCAIYLFVEFESIGMKSFYNVNNSMLCYWYSMKMCVFLQGTIRKGFWVHLYLNIPRGIYWITVSEPTFFGNLIFTWPLIRCAYDKNLHQTYLSITQSFFIWILFGVEWWKRIILHCHGIPCFYLTLLWTVKTLTPHRISPEFKSN